MGVPGASLLVGLGQLLRGWLAGWGHPGFLGRNGSSSQGVDDLWEDRWLGWFLEDFDGIGLFLMRIGVFEQDRCF